VINTYASTVFFGPHRMLGFVSVGASNPWQNVLARSAWGSVGYVIVFFALLNSVIANQNAANNSSTRNLFAMGRIRLLPGRFALVTKRFGSPYLGLWTQLVITVAVSLWLGIQYGPYTAFALTATIIVDVAVPLYILLNVACIVYFARFRQEEFNWVLHGLIPVLGIAAFVPAFFAGAGLPVFSFITPCPGRCLTLARRSGRGCSPASSTWHTCTRATRNGSSRPAGSSLTGCRAKALRR
jgi:amino acid transporter